MNVETRKAMEFARDHFALLETRLYDHISTTFRWLMATLFVANGGAIVALMGETQLPGKFFAAGWFSLGVIFTFLMGVASTVTALRAASRMNVMRAQVAEGLANDRDTSAEVVRYAQEERPTWKTWIPSYLGFLSLGFFIVGVSTLAGSLVRAAS